MFNNSIKRKMSQCLGSCKTGARCKRIIKNGQYCKTHKPKITPKSNLYTLLKKYFSKEEVLEVKQLHKIIIKDKSTSFSKYVHASIYKYDVFRSNNYIIMNEGIEKKLPKVKLEDIVHIKNNEKEVFLIKIKEMEYVSVDTLIENMFESYKSYLFRMKLEGKIHNYSIKHGFKDCHKFIDKFPHIYQPWTKILGIFVEIEYSDIDENIWNLKKLKFDNVTEEECFHSTTEKGFRGIIKDGFIVNHMCSTYTLNNIARPYGDGVYFNPNHAKDNALSCYSHNDCDCHIIINASILRGDKNTWELRSAEDSKKISLKTSNTIAVDSIDNPSKYIIPQGQLKNVRINSIMIVAK